MKYTVHIIGNRTRRQANKDARKERAKGHRASIVRENNKSGKYSVYISPKSVPAMYIGRQFFRKPLRKHIKTRR